MKGKKKLSSTAPVPLEGLDDFVMAMIEALKGAEDPYAVAEVENLMITPELEELMRFVGIATKQSGTRALFAWTDAVNNSPGGLDNEKETD